MPEVRKIVRVSLGVVCLVYGSWLQVFSHGECGLFVVGAVFVMAAFGLILGFRWEDGRND